MTTTASSSESGSAQPAPAITLTGADSAEVDAIVKRLAAEDVFGQLLHRSCRMAELGTEGDDIKLDWVDGVEKALGAPEQLRAVEAEAAGIVGQGIKQVIWAGMGGSVQTIYALKRMGYLDQPNLAIHPLDSTDPASVNRILDQIGAPGGKGLGEVLQHTMMIGVSMGMTSEEPITHLAWFELAAERAQRRRSRQPHPGDDAARLHTWTSLRAPATRAWSRSSLTRRTTRRVA